MNDFDLMKDLIKIANKEAEQQAECNHIIGLAYVWESTWDESRTLTTVYTGDDYIPTDLQPFKYCPLCGVKL